MAWLYQRPDSDQWWIGYRQNGVQVRKSTGQKDKEAAGRELARIEAMLAAQRADALTVEVYQAISGRSLPTMTLRAALDDWLGEAAGATGKRTFEKYQAFSDAISGHFHATEQGPLVSDLTREQLQQFLTLKRAAVSACTANMSRKCMSIFFRRCKNIGAITETRLRR
jgi:hypothetical protein